MVIPDIVITDMVITDMVTTDTVITDTIVPFACSSSGLRRFRNMVIHAKMAIVKLA
jgi:hypothetical protein